MFKSGTIPQGMVYIEGYFDNVDNILNKELGFFMDRYEVTNKQYKEFVDKGGYRDQKYWKNEFIVEGKLLSWKEAIVKFIDKTGRFGPSTWEGGGYLEGQDNYPVSGVSWYEAAAYAEFAEKDLPSVDHWDSGADLYTDQISRWFGSKLIPVSNFNGKGSLPIDKLHDINCFGTFGMAGNLREWCWNKTQEGRIVRGGAWDDVSYVYSQWSHLPPFDRSS
jgi:formylglycine-generating enzyme required for sulfatase activity